jgi:hypothetical protein
MEFWQHLARELAAHPAEHAVCIGMSWPPAVPCPARLTALEADPSVWADPAIIADLAVIAAAVPGGDAALTDPLRILLGTLRDRVAPRILSALATPPDGAPPAWREQMRALGFTDLGVHVHMGAAVLVSRFDIATYKSTPDWLSARNWANPEMWGRHRW